jgi:hypothetical protein
MSGILSSFGFRRAGAIGLAALAGTVLLLVAMQIVRADSTVVVSGNTSAGENQPGWMFNRDANTDTPFEFNVAQASIGSGSLYVLPIGANAQDKFIAENFILSPIASVDSISYDYMIAGSGDAQDDEQYRSPNHGLYCRVYDCNV